jgi:hypothetical protein
VELRTGPQAHPVRAAAAANEAGNRLLPMFWTRNQKADKERERFYLLPGMGGSAYRRKQRVILNYALAVGLVISALIAVLLYLLNRSNPN